ncbi:MAG: fluoride efflux transporter CrcB [Planctomycetota bacterium]
MKIFCIMLGGALGSLLRYWVSGLSYRFLPAVFPWGTLAVNLIGSLLIGLLWGIFEVVIISQNIRLLIFIGTLGAFTSFSSFSLESFNLLQDGQYGFFFLNFLTTVIVGIGLVFLGYFASRFILNILR